MDELYTQLVERTSKNSQEIRSIHEILNRHEDTLEKLQENANVINTLSYILEDTQQNSAKITNTLNTITSTLTTINLSLKNTNEKVDALSTEQKKLSDDINDVNQKINNDINDVNQKINNVDDKSNFDWMNMIKETVIPALLSGGIIYFIISLPK